LLDGAKTLVDVPLGAIMSSESSALGQPELAPVSGEIRTSWIDGSPNATLIGVGALPALRTPNTERKRHNRKRPDLSKHMFVEPVTVEAIAKARHLREEPTIEVNLPEADGPERRPDLKLVEPAHGPAHRPAHRIEHLEPPVTETKPEKWQAFDDMGLAPKPITKKAQKLVVSTYRLLGFGILSVIVAVLVGYIGTTAFYFFNHSWVTPVALSPNDEKVVALQGQLAAQLNERERLAGELDQADRSIAAEQTFQLQFAKAIKKDLEGRRMALGRVKALAQTAAATRQEIRNTNGDYSASQVAKMGDEYKAGLIDRDSMMAGKFQLAQISTANLSLAERQVEFDQRASELSAETSSLDALLSNKSNTAALSYDVLKIARDYETSKLALAKETGNRERLKSSLERQDTIIDGIKQSAFLRAAENGATVALVPYSNMKNVTKGSPLYACKLNMIMCRQVGTVRDVLPGEVNVKHPNRDTMLRGRMIEMQMTDAAAAQDDVLFAGSRPFGF
jgi:hypothetical protein